MKKFNFTIMALMVVMLSGLTGCIATPPGTETNGRLISPKDTPHQVHDKLVADYYEADRAFFLAQVGATFTGHSLPEAVVQKFRDAQKNVTEQLTAMGKYLTDHPEIRDVPAAEVTGQIALEILMKVLTKYSKSPGPDFLPTTQPSP